MPAPEEVRESAYDSAEKYIGMDYDYGGQDHYSSRGIDCSGLVVNCYAEAVSSTVYRLPYGDAAVADFRDRYTSEVQQPERGDRRG
jgi:cell wall-associated NlpC family hydrolase